MRRLLGLPPSGECMRSHRRSPGVSALLHLQLNYLLEKQPNRHSRHVPSCLTPSPPLDGRVDSGPRPTRMPGSPLWELPPRRLGRAEPSAMGRAT